jgi:hypothetical protein
VSKTKRIHSWIIENLLQSTQPFGQRFFVPYSPEQLYQIVAAASPCPLTWSADQAAYSIKKIKEKKKKHRKNKPNDLF